jgi:hypothetical protein
MLKLLFIALVVLLAFAAMVLIYRMLSKEISSFMNSPLSIALSMFLFGLMLIFIGFLFKDAGQGEYPYLFAMISGAGAIISVSTGAHALVLTFRYLTRNKQK